VIVSGDTNDYLQIHPTEKGKVNLDTMAGTQGMKRIWITSISSEIPAYTKFPVVVFIRFGCSSAWWGE
jgi:hypothetical protein